MKKQGFLVLASLSIFIAVMILGELHSKQQQLEVSKIAKEHNKEIEKQTADSKAQKEEKTRQKKIKGVGHTLRYVAMGDSLTAGYYATSKDKTYVQLLSSKLKDSMGFDVVTDQHGKPGAKLAWGLEEVSKVNAKKPDLITIEFGTNDADSRHFTDEKLFETQLNNLIDGLTINAGRSPKIVLVTTWRQYANGDRYDAIIQKVGQEKHLSVVNINSIYQDGLNMGPEGRKTYLGKGDAFHPNDQGMNIISDAIYKSVEPIVIKMVDDEEI